MVYSCNQQYLPCLQYWLFKLLCLTLELLGPIHTSLDWFGNGPKCVKSVHTITFVPFPFCTLLPEKFEKGAPRNIDYIVEHTNSTVLLSTWSKSSVFGVFSLSTLKSVLAKIRFVWSGECGPGRKFTVYKSISWILLWCTVYWLMKLTLLQLNTVLVQDVARKVNLF